MKLKSRINRFLPREVLIDLDNISRDNTISSNNKKVDLMISVLDSYSIEYEKIAPGTNRYSILVDNYVFKLALDKRGKVDNWSEFYLSREMYPHVTKTYECNGLIAVAEYVSPFRSKEEFISRKSDIGKILNQLSKDWLFGDMGTITKNFMNWGKRSDGNLVCLDYAYTYRILGNEMICGHKKKNGEICQGFLEYDEDFNMLKCPECRKVYDFIDIRNRMRSEYEDEVRENAKKLSVHFPQGVDEIEIDDEDINSINIEEDISMNYNEDNNIKYTEEDIDAMLSAEIEKCYAPIKVSENDTEENIASPVIDMRAANEIVSEVLISENDYVEESPITKEMIAKRKFERIVEEMSMPKEFYDDTIDDEWFDDPDIKGYYENEPEVVVTDNYPTLDSIIDEVYNNEPPVDNQYDDEIKSKITVIEDDESDELGDAIFDYFTNTDENINLGVDLSDNTEIESNESTDDEYNPTENDDSDSSDMVVIMNMVEEKNVEEYSTKCDVEDGSSEIDIDIIETDTEVEELKVVTEDNTNEEHVSSFIKVLDEDNNETVESMRSTLLEDDEYDDQYDDLYDQAIKDSKFRNNNRNY